MQEMGTADRLWGLVTTAMPPSHEYIAAARELHAALTDTTHDGATSARHLRDRQEFGHWTSPGRPRYTAHDVANMARDVQNLPDQLVRSGLLFAPASKLTPSVERLNERAARRHDPVLPKEVPELVNSARSAATWSDIAVLALNHATGQAFPLRVAGTGVQGMTIPEL